MEVDSDLNGGVLHCLPLNGTAGEISNGGGIMNIDDDDPPVAAASRPKAATTSRFICPDEPMDVPVPSPSGVSLGSSMTPRSFSESASGDPESARKLWPKGGNQLKLSVGCLDSEEDEDEEEHATHQSNIFLGAHSPSSAGGCRDATANADASSGLPTRNIDQLRENMRQWHMQCGPSRSEFANDFDVDEELSAERIKSIIQGDNLLFEPLKPGNFVEEVFSEKKPKILKGYLFGDVIGEGSYAKVKEVVEQYTLVRRAVKIIKGTRLRKIPNGVENVEREIRILQQVKHVNVIRLLEVFRNEEKRKLYLVMDFCMGSVQQLIESSAAKRLPESEAHFYFRQLIEGLDYLHSQGIVHKDIKPGNLLLSPQFVLKISDFGVAEKLPHFQADDSCQLVQGTPKFQAPELVSGSTDTFSGFKADVWSSGVTLYNMISGEYPFEGEVIMRLFDNIAKQPLKMPSNVQVEEWLETLLRGCLTKDPATRFSVLEIQHSEWFLKTFSNESVHSVYPDRKQSIYRPLTVCKALEQLYGPIPQDRLVSPNDLDDTLLMDMSSSDPVPSRSNLVVPPPKTGQSAGTSSSSSFVQPALAVPSGEQDDLLPESASPPPRQKTPPRRNRSFLSCLMPNHSP